MKYIRLIGYEDVNGELGLTLKDIRKTDWIFASTSGILIAHDIIEHQNGPHNIGTMNDEFQALGGIWFVRGELSQWDDHRFSSEARLANELTSLAIYYEDLKLEPWSGTRVKPLVEDFEEIFEALTDHEEFRELQPAMRHRFLNEAMLHMNIGYAKAKRRFIDQYRAYDLFYAISETVDDLLRYCDLYEGSEFRLGYGDGDAVWRPQPGTFY